jgi:N-acetylneuraminic acid mutarotase
MKLPDIFRRSIHYQSVLLLSLSLLLSTCGGGTDGPGCVDCIYTCQTGDIFLDTPKTPTTPTYNNVWGTDAASIDLGGWASTPGGLYNTANCNYDPGYTIVVKNETTNTTFTGYAGSNVHSSLLGAYCDTRWGASMVQLAPDNNHITIKAWQAGVLVGEDCIDVKRMPAAAGSWQATSITDAPSARQSHTAVWTGSQMIVWGGYDNSNYLASGGSYEPVYDTWAAIATANSPSARRGHTAVWTGSKMIVWGGYDGTSYLANGSRYDPVTDTWAAISTNKAPVGRAGHTAVWTGTAMIIWGGWDGRKDLADGARYDAASDTWAPIATTNTPSARRSHSAVWTGTDMVIWGGLVTDVFSRFNDGSRYNPSTNTWTSITTVNAPAARYKHTAVWTGSQMLVWGGSGDPNYGSLNTGGRYDLVTNSWSSTWFAGMPPSKSGHTAVWTGNEMIIWGGNSVGSIYNPVTDTWTAITINGAPTEQYNDYHSAVWTGSAMIVWGGYGSSYNWAGIYSGANLNTGGRYDP